MSGPQDVGSAGRADLGLSEVLAQFFIFNFRNSLICAVGSSTPARCRRRSSVQQRGPPHRGLRARIPCRSLAQTSPHESARPGRLHDVGGQGDVPAVGKFEIPRKDTSVATLYDVSRTIGETAGKTIDLAHDTLARERNSAE